MRWLSSHYSMYNVKRNQGRENVKLYHDRNKLLKHLQSKFCIFHLTIQILILYMVACEIILGFLDSGPRSCASGTLKKNLEHALPQ